MNNSEKIEPIIEVKDLIKSFNDLLILNKVSFNITKGEILSVLGPSGSGKTTLLRCLIGLESFNSPAESIKIKGIHSREYLNKKRIAFVPQRYSNYPWLNVFENIKLGMIKQGSSQPNFRVVSLHMPPTLMPNPWEKENELEKQNRVQNEDNDKKVTSATPFQLMLSGISVFSKNQQF